MSVRSEYIRPAFQYHRACIKRGILGVFQMKKLQHIRLREGSKADQFLSGQLTSKYFSYQEIFAMLMPLIFDQFFISVIVRY